MRASLRGGRREKKLEKASYPAYLPFPRRSAWSLAPRSESLGSAAELRWQLAFWHSEPPSYLRRTAIPLRHPIRLFKSSFWTAQATRHQFPNPDLANR